MSNYISVIIPVYNVSAYLPRCLDSILSQSFPLYQVILVNDGSSDNSGAICNDYAAKDSRFVVIHQENGGLSAARNAGLDWVFANSDSQWIAFVDSDDWVHPQFLELLYAAAKEKGTQLACCEFERVESKVQRGPLETIAVSVQHPREVYIYPDGCGEGAFAWRYLYHRNLFADIRYPIGKLWEDIFTTPKVLFQTDKLAVVHAPLYYYFSNPAGITKRQWTPRNLDSVEALEFNVAFFYGCGEDRLCKQSIKSYLGMVAYQYACVEKSSLKNREKKQLARKLRYKLRYAICKYHKQEVISFRKDGHIYETAWPKLTKLRWALIARLNKYIKPKN